MTPSPARTPWNFKRQLAWLCAIALVCAGGCERQSSDPPPPTPKTSPAQAKFDEIVSYMNRMLVESDAFGPGGYVQFPATDHNPALGQLAYTIHIDASPQVLPPRDAGGPERASIKVTLDTSYSRTEQDDAAEEEAEPASKNQGRSLDDILEDPNTNIEDLTAENLLEGQTPPRRAPQRSITTKSRSEEMVFDLEYIQGKWKLVSEVDREEFPSAVSTLETALERQR